MHCALQAMHAVPLEYSRASHDVTHCSAPCAVMRANAVLAQVWHWVSAGPLQPPPHTVLHGIHVLEAASAYSPTGHWDTHVVPKDSTAQALQLSGPTLVQPAPGAHWASHA